MTEEFSLDVHYMRQALRQAQLAAEAGEVPVGVVIVHERQVIGLAHNQVELLKDPTAHAEILAITQAATALGDWRLNKAVMYVTKEPCPMCAGAIVQARVGKVCWGMTDPKRGGATSLFNILANPALNHQPEIHQGLLEPDCKQVMQEFFRARRQEEGANHLRLL